LNDFIKHRDHAKAIEG
jgi:predicted  nucleic acid-binding Zn-ribbon protein